ncbi:MAG: hypothetical protein HYU64_08850 [Armatimonadetes bacterium]|nr:hypothetical protein [Armatimonadota bacterium]
MERTKAIVPLRRADKTYPNRLAIHLGSRSPEIVNALGALEILKQKTLVLFCSIRCQGNLILKTYDLARELWEPHASKLPQTGNVQEEE